MIAKNKTISYQWHNSLGSVVEACLQLFGQNCLLLIWVTKVDFWQTWLLAGRRDFFQNGRRNHMLTITVFLFTLESDVIPHFQRILGHKIHFWSYFTDTDYQNGKNIKWQRNTFLFFVFLNFQLTNLFRPGLLEMLSFLPVYWWSLYFHIIILNYYYIENVWFSSWKDIGYQWIMVGETK